MTPGAVGPSICGSCYEVPEEMLALSAQREPACASRTSWGTPGLDVAAGVLAQLERAGVGHISAGQWCTYEDPRFFSYRRDGVTGRLAGIGVPRYGPSAEYLLGVTFLKPEVGDTPR